MTTGAIAVEKIRDSYRARVDEYIEHLGSAEAMAAEDRGVIADWAASITGRALDAGSGPGFWPIDALKHELARAGFAIVDTHARTDLGSRPHGAILTRRKVILDDVDE